MFGWVTATPLDVVKSRIQASEGKVKLVPVIKELYREEGKSSYCIYAMYVLYAESVDLSNGLNSKIG